MKLVDFVPYWIRNLYESAEVGDTWYDPIKPNPFEDIYEIHIKDIKDGWILYDDNKDNKNMTRLIWTLKFCYLKRTKGTEK